MMLLRFVAAAVLVAAAAEGRACYQRIADVQLGANDKGLKDAPFGNPLGKEDPTSCMDECEKLGCTLFTNDYGIGGNCWFYSAVPAATALDTPGVTDTYFKVPCAN